MQKGMMSMRNPLMPNFLDTITQPNSAKRTEDLLGDLLGKSVDKSQINSIFSSQYQ
jgi:hypothetical protein